MNYSKYTSLTTRILVGTLALGLVFMAGCWTKRVEGTKTENQAPTVWFSNVPADSTRTSVNPIIYWVGQDIDGQVVTFRYTVVREIEVAHALGIDTTNQEAMKTLSLTETQVQQFVDGTLKSKPDSAWTYLYVDPLQGKPQTTNIIPMSAEIGNPVLKYVPQFVFVQAFDDLNAASEIAFRRLLRNDNPPDTRMVGWVIGRDRPFINSVLPGGITTGIPVAWAGEDRIDYPTEPPPFEFEWRLYGPYSDAVYDSIVNGWGISATEKSRNKLVKQVFVTNDARVYVFGRDEWIKTCDTIPNGTGGFDIDCDSTYVDGILASGPLGTLDTMLLVDDSSFANHPSFNKVTDSSWSLHRGTTWIPTLKDTLYDVFRNEPSESTQQAKFIFWVRSRDDAKVPDLTPTFVEMDVVNPKYEREVIVVWMNNPFTLQPSKFGAARHYWWEAVRTWQEAAGLPLNFDSVADFINPAGPTGTNLPLRSLLSHKVVILYGDDVQPGVFSATSIQNLLYTAIDAGVNIWLCHRTPLIGGEDKEARFEAPADFNYRFYFGVQALTFSGWEWAANGFHYDPPKRIEDFIGTYSLDATKWPELSVDTARLHSLYVWNYDYRPDLGALPEVDWCVRGFETEAMYLYKSMYGPSHPLGEAYSFDGRPVAHRLNRGYFRTVHSLFTPLAMEQVTAQQWVNNVMDFLYAPFLTGSAVASGVPIRQGNANAILSADAYRANYFLRRSEGTDPQGTIRYYYGQPVTPEVIR